MKYFHKLKIMKRHFSCLLRYIATAIIFSTIEAHGVIGGNTYEDVFTRDIYDVSEVAQGKFRQARREDANKRDKHLAGLAHEAAKVYEEGGNDYLAVATLYYQKFQCVHGRLANFLIGDKNFLEERKNQLKKLHKEKAGASMITDVLKSITIWAAAYMPNLAQVPSPTYAAMYPVGYAALHLFSFLSNGLGGKELDLNRDIGEIDKTINEINKKIAQVEEGVVNEPIKILEESYVKQKALGENFIKEDLQYTIEENLINSRKATYPFPWVKKCLENALKLPHTYKRLTFTDLDGFRTDEFFQRYGLATRQELEAVAVDLIKSSNAPDSSKVPLRSICYVHGIPGIGKTEAINHLAEIFGLPFIQENIISVNDLNKDNLVGMDALTPGSTPGWLNRALLATNSKGKTYQNSILILDEFDRILLDKNSGATGLGFFLDFLDPRKKSFYSPYFNAEIDISRMHIFVTGNSEIPDTEEYKALKERFSKILKFEPMGTEQQKDVLLEYLGDLGKFYTVPQGTLDRQRHYLTETAMQYAQNPSSIRSCKQELRNIVSDFDSGGREKVHARIQRKEKEKLEKSARVVKKTEAAEQLECLRKAFSYLLSTPDPILENAEEAEEDQYISRVSEEIESVDAVQSSIRENAIELGIPLEMGKK